MVAEHGHAVADDLGSDPIMRRDPLGGPNYLSSAPAARGGSQIRRAPSASGLYDVLDLILDKGIVIDAFVRVSLVGIELLTVDLRVVIASVDTYLRYAEGVERLGVYDRTRAAKLPDVVGGGMKGMAVKQGAKKLGQAIKGDDDNDADDGDNEGVGGKLTHAVTRGVGRLVHSITGSGEDDDDNGEQSGQDEDRGGESERRSGNGAGGNDRKGRHLPGRAMARPSPGRR